MAPWLSAEGRQGKGDNEPENKLTGAGQTAASVSSSGSADSNAETNIGNIPYSLKWPTAVVPASTEAGPHQPPLARKIAHRPVFQNIRRIGHSSLWRLIAHRQQVACI